MNRERDGKKMVNNNYEVAWRHYSYSVFRNRFSAIMNDFFDEPEQQQLSNKLSDQKTCYLFK